MWGPNDRRGGTILPATLKLVAALGLCGYGIATWLSHGGLDNPRIERLVTALRDGNDPATTGSIGSAHSFRLDPCSLPRR